MEIVSNIALITINVTLFHQLIAFLIFVFIINRIMFRPLQKVMGERDSFIEKIKLETVDAAKELERLTDELKERESAVRTKAMEVRRELEAGGSQEATEIFASTNKEIETIKENAENEINAQILGARKHLQKESETLVVNIMESLLNRRLAP